MTEDLRSFERSDALYERSIELIPLASQTFSKSALSLVKGASPLFLERGEGARVWDVDGNEYVDYVLGLLPVVLGYRDPDVDAAVREQLERGVSFSLATRLEAELAERLVRLIPCAEMVRYGKNGSDATSAAVRLARAHTGRDRIACCGYHGWHDWYIGSTTRNLGVPQAIQALTSTFPYNDPDALEGLLKAAPDAYAAVILEPMEFTPPAPGFLESVRALTERYGVVLIFDEIVTGFRIHLGGAQAAFGVTPDLAAVGKAMGNGLPISAIVGRREIMRRMNDIFFSGTFGGEALSLAASIATIDKLERVQAIPRMHTYGAKLADGLRTAFARHGLDGSLKLVGADWWPRVMPAGGAGVEEVLLVSLLRQELFANGILQLSSCNVSLAHTADGVLEETLRRWDVALDALSGHLRSNDPRARLRGEPIQPVFQVRR